jgi:hypothetical protein
VDPFWIIISKIGKLLFSKTFSFEGDGETIPLFSHSNTIWPQMLLIPLIPLTKVVVDLY